MLLIQTLQAIFKDARMREQAGLIKVEVVRLLDVVGRLKDRLLDLQRHFGQANADIVADQKKDMAAKAAAQKEQQRQFRKLEKQLGM